MITDHASALVIAAGAQVVLDQGAPGTGAGKSTMLAGNRKSEIGIQKVGKFVNVRQLNSSTRAVIRRRGGILTEAIQSSRLGCPWPPAVSGLLPLEGSWSQHRVVWNTLTFYVLLQ